MSRDTTSPHAMPGATSPLTPTLLRIPEACARLRISRATLYRELERGRLRTVPVGPSGRARRVRVADLEQYEELLRREADEGR